MCSALKSLKQRIVNLHFHFVFTGFIFGQQRIFWQNFAALCFFCSLVVICGRSGCSFLHNWHRDPRGAARNRRPDVDCKSFSLSSSSSPMQKQRFLFFLQNELQLPDGGFLFFSAGAKPASLSPQLNWHSATKWRRGKAKREIGKKI